MKAAIILVRKTCRPSVIVTDQDIGFTKSSQTTAANEFNPDDIVLDDEKKETSFMNTEIGKWKSAYSEKMCDVLALDFRDIRRLRDTRISKVPLFTAKSTLLFQ